MDDFGLDGTFRIDGSVVFGSLGTLPQKELAYRIWFQTHNLDETEARKIWETL